MTRATFHHELDALEDAVRTLGEAVDRQVARAMAALRNGDPALAAAVRANDRAINDQYVHLEGQAAALLARQAPMAGDLRRILAARSTAMELERIADHAADIAEAVVAMRNAPALELPHSMTEMAEHARTMLNAAVAAFAARDVAGARALGRADDEVDALEAETYHALIDRARRDGTELERSIVLITAAHHLERIADRATNIAEHAVYAATGVLDELNPPHLAS